MSKRLRHSRGYYRRRRMHHVKQIFILLLIIALVGGGIYWLLPKSEEVADAVEPTPTPTAQEEEEIVLPEVETETYTIVVDSGHSFPYGGAVGIEYEGTLILEENITAETSQYLYEMLDADPNFEVYLTHEYDEYMSIADRRDYAATLDPDFLISIHANGNAQTDDISGFEVYAQVPEHPYHEESYVLAQYIVDEFVEAGHTPRSSTGIYYMRYVLTSSGDYETYVLTELEEEIYDFTGDETLGILEHEDFPALLVEQGYVTSYEDVSTWLTGDGCKNCATVYYQALCTYFGVEPME